MTDDVLKGPTMIFMKKEDYFLIENNYGKIMIDNRWMEEMIRFLVQYREDKFEGSFILDEKE